MHKKREEQQDMTDKNIRKAPEVRREPVFKRRKYKEFEGSLQWWIEVEKQAEQRRLEKMKNHPCRLKKCVWFNDQAQCCPFPSRRDGQCFNDLEIIPWADEKKKESENV